MSESNLLIVGSIGLDTIETASSKVERVLGGAAVYSAVAAAPFCTPAIIGVVGDDFPAEHREMLTHKGIDVSGMDTKPGKTFFWHGRYEEDMNNRVTLDTQLGVFGEFSPSLSDAHKKIPNVFLANIHPQLQLDVLDSMKSDPFVAMDTMNLWIETTPDLLNKVIERVNMLFVNDEEARMLTGKTTVLDAADTLLTRGPEIVVIKKGDAGAVLFRKDDIFSVPALFLRNVKDPTGAGDTFAGGLMGFLARENSTQVDAMRQAAVLGTVMASFTVEDFSLNKLGDVLHSDIHERISTLKNLTAFLDIKL